MSDDPATVDPYERLRQIAALEHFSDHQIRQLASRTSRTTFAPGSTIVSQGDSHHDVVFVIDDGEIAIRRDTPYGLFDLATLESDDIFGEAAFIDQSERSGDAVAIAETALFPLSREALADLLDEDQKFTLALYWAFWKSLSKKLRATNEQLAHFFSQEPPERAAPEPRRDPTGEFRIDIGDKRELFREARLSPMEIHFLATLSREKRLEPREVLFREGDQGDQMYVVVDGKVMISKHITDAGEEALAFLERGEFFGEMALIDHQPRSANASADENGAVVLGIPGDVLENILDPGKVSSLRLLKLLSNLVVQRLREIDEKLVGWFIFSGGTGGTRTRPTSDA